MAVVFCHYFAAPEDTLQVPEVRSAENNVGDHTEDGTGDNEGHVTVNGDIATEESENQETEEPMEEGMRWFGTEILYREVDTSYFY